MNIEEIKKMENYKHFSEMFQEKPEDFIITKAKILARVDKIISSSPDATDITPKYSDGRPIKIGDIEAFIFIKDENNIGDIEVFTFIENENNFDLNDANNKYYKLCSFPITEIDDYVITNSTFVGNQKFIIPIGYKKLGNSDISEIESVKNISLVNNNNNLIMELWERKLSDIVVGSDIYAEIENKRRVFLENENNKIEMLSSVADIPEDKLENITKNIIASMFFNKGFLEEFALNNDLYVELVDKLVNNDKVKIMLLPIVKFKGGTFSVDEKTFINIDELFNFINDDKYNDILLYNFRFENSNIVVKLSAIDKTNKIYN